MSLYHVQYDGVSYWVEAVAFSHCVDIWKNNVRELWGSEFDGTEEPESVHRVSGDAVLRTPDPAPSTIHSAGGVISALNEVLKPAALGPASEKAIHDYFIPF